MAYNLLNLTSRVRSKLKDTSYSSSDIKDALNDTQLELSLLFHWSHLEKSVEGTLTVDEYTYEQQDDHQTTFSLILLDPTDDNDYWDVTKFYLNKDDFIHRFPVPSAQDSSKPHFWTEYGDQLYFHCPASEAFRMRQYYYRNPVDMEADADVPDYPVAFREVLVLGATYRIEQDRENFDFAQLRQNEFNDKVSDLIERFAVRQLASPEVVVVGMNNAEKD